MELVELLPEKVKDSLTPEIITRLSNFKEDPLFAQEVRENFIGYADIISTSKFKIDDYLNAVVYCSYRLRGMNKREAYIKTFPDRYLTLKSKGIEDISPYVTAYNKGKLVNQIMEQSMVPMWVLNHDIYQKAIMTQAELMNEAKSERVRCMAAESILNHLSKPEKTIEKASEVNINIDTSGMDTLKKTMAKLAKTQMDLIREGVDTRVVAETPLEVVDVKPLD